MQFFKFLIWYFFCKHVIGFIPNKYAIRIVFAINNIRFKKKHYRQNFTNPATFNEKINFLKLNYRDKLIPLAADKVTARDYVSKTIGKSYLVPLIAIYNSVEEINFADLPDRFALKTSHGCGGMNLICKDKKLIKWNIEKRKLNTYLSIDTNVFSREWQYNKNPKLICEKLLDFDIADYKLFCNDGVVKAIQVDLDRFTDHKRYFMNSDWESLDFNIRYESQPVNLEKPHLLHEIIEIAERLSSPFIFSRVDLYIHDNKVYFGELTFHPGGGTESFLNYEQDLAFGNLFSLGKI